MGVAELLPAYAGLLLEQELEMLGRLLDDVERPFVLVAGGAKVEDKLGVLRNLGARADAVLIGGKMAEELRDGSPLPFEAVLPTDVVAAAAFDGGRRGAGRAVRRVPDGWLGLDIGPETRERFAAEIRGARTVFWNGPMGVFEWPRFAEGTKAVAQAVGRRRRATRSSAEATRCARSRSSASRTASPGSRQAAARRSSCSRARSSRRGCDPARVAAVRPGRRTHARDVAGEEVEDRRDLADALVHVERAVPGLEDVDLVRVVARGELLDVAHRLPVRAAAVVPADDEEHGRRDVVGEVDRVAVAHELGHLLRRLPPRSARSYAWRSGDSSS